jgi:hypothetical protein
VSEFYRYRWAPWARFLAPEHAKALTVPSNGCLRLDDNQGVTPGEQPGKQHECNSDRCIRPVRFGFALLEHGQLLAQKQILGSERALRTKGKQNESGQVAEQYDYDFYTFHDGQYLAIAKRDVRFEGSRVLTNQQDSIIADDSRARM